MLWSLAFNPRIYTSLTPAIRVHLMVISMLIPTHIGEQLRLLQSQRIFSINKPELAPLASELSLAGGAGDLGGFCSFLFPAGLAALSGARMGLGQEELCWAVFFAL